MASGGVNSYQDISRDEAVAMTTGVTHAAHVMLYAKVDGKALKKYEIKYAILMQLRFDGTLGFPGGIVDKGETPEQAVTREMREELGSDAVGCGLADHVMAQVSTETRFCLHFYAKKISLELFEEIEASSLAGGDYGSEVMGVVRCPLFTTPYGLGLPGFLCHQFIGNCRDQLIRGITHCQLLTSDDLLAAMNPPKRPGSGATYKPVSRAEGVAMATGVRQAAHTVLYARVTEKLFGKYEQKYTILMMMRHDGTLGFPGGFTEPGESPEMAANREIGEEMGCVVDGDLSITEVDHVMAQVSYEPTRERSICLHSYYKEVSLERLHQLELSALKGPDHGHEVFGVLRCPLYTLPNGLGLPAFLGHCFISDSRDQLLRTITVKKLLSPAELQAALEQCNNVKTLVTVEDTDI